MASVQRIERIDPIIGKDRIGLAKVLGWHVIIALDQFSAGDLCVYVEIDSVLPERPEFEFLRKRGFHIRTMKMAGVYSEGICFPLSILPDGQWSEGDDVTEQLGVTKYDEYGDETPKQKKRESPKGFRGWLFSHRLTRPLAIALFGGTKKERCGFPTEVSKTDETRIQTLPYDAIRDANLRYDVREKLDGQSATYLLRRGRFGGTRFIVCSRNLEIPRPDDSSYWEMARKYDVRDALMRIVGSHPWVCVQGEIVGPGIQGNPYKLTERRLYAFNLIYPEGKMDGVLAETLLAGQGIPFVPLVDGAFTLPETCDELVALADGTSRIAPVAREGLVLRNYAKGVSFKAVSQAYLVKHGK